MRTHRDRWHSNALNVLGITDADIRTTTPVPGYDMIDVTLWNHRQLRITGYEIASGQRRQ